MLTHRESRPAGTILEIAPRLSGTAIDHVLAELEQRHPGRCEVGRRRRRGRCRTAARRTCHPADRESDWFHATRPTQSVALGSNQGTSKLSTTPVRSTEVAEGPCAPFPMPRLAKPFQIRGTSSGLRAVAAEIMASRACRNVGCAGVSFSPPITYRNMRGSAVSGPCTDTRLTKTSHSAQHQTSPAL